MKDSSKSLGLGQKAATRSWMSNPVQIQRCMPLGIWFPLIETLIDPPEELYWPSALGFERALFGFKLLLERRVFCVKKPMRASRRANPSHPFVHG
jgi:hypothetical protein